MTRELLLEEMVAPEQTALIIIDIQNDFCHEDGAFGKAKKDLSMIAEMIPRLAEFIKQTRKISLPAIYVRTTHDDWTNSKAYIEMNHVRKRPAICTTGTWGSDFYTLSPWKDDYIVTKHRYSAFQGTDLEMMLRCKGINTLLIAGIMTNICVESTLRDGFNRDFFTILVEDCCASDRLDLHRATLENVKDYFGDVASTESLFKIWENSYGRRFS